MKSMLISMTAASCIVATYLNGFSNSFAAEHKQQTAETKLDEPAQRARIEARLKSFHEFQKSTYEKIQAIENEEEQGKLFKELFNEDTRACRELIDIALRDPKTEAAKQALIWVINKPGRGAAGDYIDEFARAAGLLVRNHGDDPEVAGVCMWMHNIFCFSRDAFLHGMATTAKSRETKALIQFALAQYLFEKAYYAGSAQARTGRLEFTSQTKGKGGKMETTNVDAGDEINSYYDYLRLVDVDALNRKAESMLEEVARDYADIPGKSIRYWDVARWLKADPPARNGIPLTSDEIEQARKMLKEPIPKLGELAKEQLDKVRNLAQGKPAPEIDAEGVDGKRFKLSDFRGKVVVLIFWGTWCGPCMGDVPHEREIAKKYKDKPVTLLGVDCDSNRDEALKVMKKEGMTWPNWFDGKPGEGPIAKAYHVEAYPTVLLIDAEGKIRFKDCRGKELEEMIDKLLAEMKVSRPAG